MELAGLRPKPRESGDSLANVEGEFGIEDVQHAQAAIGGLAANGESLGKDIVQGLAFGKPLAQLDGLARQGLIVQDLHGGAQGVDGLHFGPEAFDLAIVAGPE